MLTWNKEITHPPEIFYFQEFILQTLTRLWLSSNKNLQFLFDTCGLNSLNADNFEVLGEKALPEGHIDILVKDKAPAGESRKIIIEVKIGKARPKDIHQLKHYMNELGKECIKGVLIAKDFSKKILSYAKGNKIKCFTYYFSEIDNSQKYTLNELQKRFKLLQDE